MEFQGKTNGFDCMYIDVHKGKTACFDTESTHYGLFENSPYVPMFQLLIYSNMAGVIESMAIPIDANFSLAML